MFESPEAAEGYGGHGWHAAWLEGEGAPCLSTLDLWRESLKVRPAAPTAVSPAMVSGAPHKGKQTRRPWKGAQQKSGAAAVRSLNTDGREEIRKLHLLASEVAGGKSILPLPLLLMRINESRQYLESVNRTLRAWPQWCAKLKLDPVGDSNEVSKLALVMCRQESV